MLRKDNHFVLKMSDSNFILETHCCDFTDSGRQVPLHDCFREGSCPTPASTLEPLTLCECESAVSEALG